MMNSCLERQEKLKIILKDLSPEETYNKIIELGRNLPKLDPKFFLAENLVPGCQSIMYVHTEYVDGHFHIYAHSDALISKGLAALLIYIYHDLPPSTLFTCPPKVLQELNIFASLSPTRAVGLGSLFNKLQHEAKKYL